MTSNPTTPISIRRNNFLSQHCDNNDVITNTTTTTTTATNVSKIPLPSPGSFRRSVSLRLRGSKSCLFNSTTKITTSTSPSSSSPSTNDNRIMISKTMASSSKTLDDTPTTTPTKIRSSSLSNTKHITPPPTISTLKISPTSKIAIFSNDMFRPNNITTPHTTSDNSTTTTDTVDTSSFENVKYHRKCDDVGQEEISCVLTENQDITKITNDLKTCSLKNVHKDNELLSENLQGITKNNENELENMENNIESSSSEQPISSTCPSSSGGSSVAAIGKKSSAKRDPNGMSLNLNGPITTTTTTTTAATNNSQESTTTTRTPKTPHTPKTPSSIGPLPKPTPKTPPVTPDSPHIYLDDDLDSVYSYSSATSGRSTMSCEHPYVARNGTTFSGRKMKYVVHCSSYAGQVGEDYLTPTQRAQKQLRRLKELLIQARQDLEQKDSEILRLTREVVELRLFKASLSSPEDRSNSSDAVTVREATTDLKTSQDVSPIVDMIDEGGGGGGSGSSCNIKSSPRHVLHNHGINQVQYLDKMTNSEMQSSFADSGHFEDMTTSSVHSKDSYNLNTQDRACGTDTIQLFEEQKQELIRIYEKRIEELIKTQDTQTSDIKRSHNDKVEALLQKLAECNTRYADLVPDYEQAKERIRELEKQLEDLQYKLQEQDDKQKKIYLHMYTKEQEAERIAQADQMLELAHRPSNRVSISELLKQLQSTQDELENIRASNYRSESGSSHVLLTAKEAISLWVLGARKTIYKRLLEAQENKTRVDPEVTLQFLKSAIYYFLTDKENSQGHLNAIESILEFTEQEKQNINRARSSK